MSKIIKNSWALFLGMSMIMLSYGYQNSLLGVRAVAENFSLASTGFMMSGYFVGYFIGARTATPLISSVGHLRGFAAFASFACRSSLLWSLHIGLDGSIPMPRRLDTQMFRFFRKHLQIRVAHGSDLACRRAGPLCRSPSLVCRS